MVRKISILSSASVFLVLSLLAPAQTAPATPNDSILGTLEGVLDFCGKVNPTASSTYQQLDALLTNGLTPASVTQSRKNQDYKNSHAKISQQLGELSKKQAVDSCTPQ